MTLSGSCSDLEGACCDSCHDDDDAGYSDLIGEEFDSMSLVEPPVLIRLIRCCSRKKPTTKEGWLALINKLKEKAHGTEA